MSSIYKTKSFWTIIGGCVCLASLSMCQKVEEDRRDRGVYATPVVDDKAKPKPKPQYTLADFDWSDTPEAKPIKTAVVAGINRTIRENERCADVQTTSLAIAVGQYTKKHPVFFVVCDTSDGNSFGTTFNASDAEKEDADFHAVRIVDKDFATKVCRYAAKQEAANPDSVVFPILADPNFQTFPSGKATIAEQYTASSVTGQTKTYKIICFFTGSKLVDHVIKSSDS